MARLGPEEQQKYLNKLYTTAIQSCMPKITIDEAQEVHTHLLQFFVENQDFNPAHMFYLFDSFDYSAPSQNLEEDLTQNQKHLLKFIKQFDEEMQVKREEKEAMDEDKQYSEE